MRKKTKLVYGVGINDADYAVYENISVPEGGKKKQKRIGTCHFYLRWKNMLQRCYLSRFQERWPTYKGCSVCDEWLRFSNFKNWMEGQDYDGKCLDKDILFPGNKVYSPDTCVFVDQNINKFLIEASAGRGQWMIGVHWERDRNKFKAHCRDGSGKMKTLGRFETELEAHQAWLKFKQEVALKLASEQTDPRVAKALIERYENYVSQDSSVPEFNL